VEIIYRGYYLPKGTTGEGEGGGRVLFDSSGVRGDVGTVQFVLNKQPFGQFPTAFNLGCKGIRTGETRRVRIPRVLGLEREGRRRGRVPEDVEGYVYEIECVLINAMN